MRDRVERENRALRKEKKLNKNIILCCHLWPYTSNSKSLQSNPKSFLTFATSDVFEFLVFDVLNAKNLAIRIPDTSAQRVWEFMELDPLHFYLKWRVSS